MSIRINESTELPITTGTIEVDTTNGAITIFMKPGPVHKKKETLTITKVSRDPYMITLFGETNLINGNEIVIFGLPIYARVHRGKVKTLVLRSDGTHWQIIREE
jgi:hypothetical protein